MVRNIPYIEKDVTNIDKYLIYRYYCNCWCANSQPISWLDFAKCFGRCSASGLLLDIILVALKGHKFIFIWLLCLDQAMVTWPLCQPHQDRLTSNNLKQAEIAMVVSPWSWKVRPAHVFPCRNHLSLHLFGVKNDPGECGWLSFRHTRRIYQTNRASWSQIEWFLSDPVGGWAGIWGGCMKWGKNPFRGLTFLGI